MTAISNAVASSSKKSNRSQLPLSLSVSQRDEANQLIPQTSDAQALVESMEIKRWRVKESDKWVDRLMFKDEVGAEYLKKSSAYLQAHQYQSILHERHLSSVCSYPRCSNPPHRPFSSDPGWKLVSVRRPVSGGGKLPSSRKHDFVRTEGNYEDGFCSKECRGRSMWFERALRVEPVWVRELEREDERRKWEVDELLEDLERTGKFSFGGQPPDRSVTAERAADAQVTAKSASNARDKAVSTGHAVTSYDVDEPPTVEVATPMASISALTPAEEESLRPRQIEEKPPPAVMPNPPELARTTALKQPESDAISQSQFTKLLSDLRIVEHETPKDRVPEPPSLGPAAREGISELAPVPSGSIKEQAPPRTSKMAPGTSPRPADSAESLLTSRSPLPIKAKEKERRRFMQQGDYITPSTGIAGKDVPLASREGAAMYLAQEASQSVSEQAMTAEEDEQEETAEETDSEQALEDMIFEQMAAAKHDMEEDERW